MSWELSRGRDLIVMKLELYVFVPPTGRYTRFQGYISGSSP